MEAEHNKISGVDRIEMMKKEEDLERRIRSGQPYSIDEVLELIKNFVEDGNE